MGTEHAHLTETGGGEVVEPVVHQPARVDEGLGNQGFTELNQGLMGIREAPSLLDSLSANQPDSTVGDTAGMVDPLQSFGLDAQDVFDPADRAGGWAEARGQDWAERYGLERLGGMPLSLGFDENGLSSGQINFSNDWSVSASEDTLGVGRGDNELSVTAGATNAFDVQTDAEGTATGSSLSLGTRMGVDGQLALSQLRIGGGYSYDASTEVTAAALEDGTVLDPAALAARAAAIEAREIDDEDGAAQARAVIDDLLTWQEGDSVRTATETAHSLDVGIAGPTGFSVGGGEEGISERIVESLGDGVVQVTMSNMDTDTAQLAATAGFGAAQLGLSGQDSQIEVQQVTFDLNEDSGQRDFVLNQYAGLLPGAAEALGITTAEEAIAFVEAGGLDSIEDFEGTAADLNASLADRAAEDAEFADANHYTELARERATSDAVDLSLFGISLFSSSSGSRFGERTTYEDGERTRGTTASRPTSRGAGSSRTVRPVARRRSRRVAPSTSRSTRASTGGRTGSQVRLRTSSAATSTPRISSTIPSSGRRSRATPTRCSPPPRPRISIRPTSPDTSRVGGSRAT